MDKVNEKVDTDCSKQENGNDVESSMEVMVVDVDKQDNNMLILTKLIHFANLWLIGEEDGDTERSGPAGRDRAGEGGTCWGWEVLEMKKWEVGVVGDEKVSVEDVVEKMFEELGDTWPR